MNFLFIIKWQGFFMYSGCESHQICKYILLFCWVCFHFLDSMIWSFEIQIFSILMKSNFSIYLSLIRLLMSCLRIHCHIQNHRDLVIYFLFWVLYFWILHLNPWVILSDFSMWYKVGNQVNSLHPGIPTIFVSNTFSPYWIVWVPFQKLILFQIQVLTSVLIILSHWSTFLYLGQYHLLLLKVVLF